MKPIQISLSPTRSRSLNMFLGIMLALVSILLFLALASYHPADPSLNTATSVAMPHAVHNWTGLFGAYLSDVLLQAFGIAAFLLPLWLGSLSWDWMHSRSSGSAWLRLSGCALALMFAPAVFGLLPWHWHWIHAVPIEGVMGRLIAGMLVSYLNIQGAWLVASVLAAAGVYFATAISLRTIRTFVEDRWIHAIALNDRWRNWREERAEHKAESEAMRAQQESPGPDQRLFSGSIDSATDAEPEPPASWPGRLALLFSRRERPFEPDPVEDIPAFQRSAAQPTEAQIPVEPLNRRTSIWERTVAQSTSAAAVPAAATVPQASSRVVEIRPAPVAQQPARAPEPAPAPAPPPGEIAIHERADAEVRTATVAPKHVSGFKLPPSTLLNAGEGPQAIR